MRLRILSAVLLVLFLAAPRGAPGQSVPNSTLVDVARAQLDMIQPDTAAALLNRVLDARSNATAPEQLRAWMLLGIAELQRGRQQAARFAFRRSLDRDPQLRIDSLAYLHSDLRRVFAQERDSVRLDTDVPVFVGLRASIDTVLAPSDGRLVLDVSPRRRVRVTATITPNGRNDVIWSDTLNVNQAGTLEWDLTSGGVPVSPGRYVLHVVATDPTGRPIQPAVRNLVVSRTSVDTLVAPDMEDSLLPDSVPVRPSRSILAGLALGAGTLALTSLAGNKELEGSAVGGRYLVAGAVSVAALVGFMSGHKYKYSAANAAYNDEVTARHNARVMETSDENQRRMASAPLRVRMATPRGGE